MELRFNFHADFQRIRRVSDDDIPLVETIEDDDAAVFFIASQDRTGISQAAVIDNVNEVTAVLCADCRLGDGNLGDFFRRGNADVIEFTGNEQALGVIE